MPSIGWDCVRQSYEGGLFSWSPSSGNGLALPRRALRCLWEQHLFAIPGNATREPDPRCCQWFRDNLPGWLRVVALLAAYHTPAFAIDCLIEATQTVELASPVTGLLDKVLVKRADRVSKGQIVATLESRAEHAAAELARFKSEQVGPIAMAENKIEFAKRKFGRRQVMTNEKLMSAQERDDSEADLRLAEAELKVAQENRQIARIEFQQQSSLLNLRTLRSPFDGVVVDQTAYPGEVVEPGGNRKAILKLAQLDPLKVQVVFPKDAFGKVAPGAIVDVYPEVPTNAHYTAKVKAIDRLIDAASGVFVVLLEMPNPNLAIPAGVKCKAFFPGNQGGPPPK